MITFAGSKRPGAAQSVALFAGAVRTVERERPGLELGDARAAFGTGELLRVEALLAVDHDDQNQTVRQLGGRFDGGLEALLDSRLDQQAVDDHFDGVILPPVDGDLLVERSKDAVDAGAHEALACQFLEIFLEFAFAAAHDGSHHHDAVLGLQSEHVLQDLFGGLAGDLVAAGRAMRDADGGIQYAKVVVNLGDRADRRPGAAAGGLLFNRDGGAQAIDGVHIRAFHLIEELPGIGGQGFDVSPLSFRVNGIERQRGFSRTAQAGDDGQTIPGNSNVDIS